MIKRILEQQFRDRLFTGKAIILMGPRQTGKTTLLNTIFSKEPGVTWLHAIGVAPRHVFYRAVSVINLPAPRFFIFC